MPIPGTYTYNQISNGTQLTVASPTVAGANRAILIGVGLVDGSETVTITSVTRTGDTVEPVATAPWALAYRKAVYQIIGPAENSNSIVVDVSTNCEITAVVIPFTDVNQTTPRGTAVTDAGNATSPSVTVSSATGELAIDFVRGDTDWSMGSGQSLLVDEEATGWSKVSTEAGAAPDVTMGWVGSSRWSQVGFSLKPPGGGGSTTDAKLIFSAGAIP
jgi:hypothetical protein